MPTFLKMAEVLLGSAAGFFPYLLLLIYPFRNHLRLKGIPAGALSFALIPLVLYRDVTAALAGTPPLASLLWDWASSFLQLRQSAHRFGRCCSTAAALSAFIC